MPVLLNSHRDDASAGGARQMQNCFPFIPLLPGAIFTYAD